MVTFSSQIFWMEISRRNSEDLPLKEYLRDAQAAPIVAHLVIFRLMVKTICAFLYTHQKPLPDSVLAPT